MKKTKLKLVAVATALAMTFALAVTATGCSDGGDATTTDGTGTEDASGGSSSGSGSGSGSETDSGSSSGTDNNGGSTAVNPETGTTTDETSGTAEGKSPTAANVLSIDLSKNAGGNNNQGVLSWIASNNEYVPKKGDTVQFDFTATASSAPSAGDKILKGFLVDNTSAANYWTLLSGYSVSESEIAAEATDYSLSFELTGTASDESAAACKLGLYFQDMQDDTVTLTFTKMKITYNSQVVLNYEASTADPVTILDASTWSYSGNSEYAATAEVVDISGTSYIKVSASGWNSMVFLPEGVDMSSYTKLTFTAYAEGTNATEGHKMYIAFLENTTDWPVLGDCEATPPVTAPTEYTVALDLSGTANKQLDMIKFFGQDTSNWNPCDMTIYISSIKAQ